MGRWRGLTVILANLETDKELAWWFGSDRFGMQENEMGETAMLMKAVLEGKNVKNEVISLRGRFPEMHFA